MANPNIFQHYLQPPRSMADYGAELDKTEANGLALQGQRQGMADANALRRATQSFGNDTAQNLNALQRAGLYKEAAAYQKQIGDARKTEADIGLSNAHAGNFTQQTAASKQDQSIKAHEKHLQELQGVTSPDQFMQWLSTGVGAGAMTLQGAAGIGQQLQQDPSKFDAIKQSLLQSGVAVQERFKQEQENARNTATNATHVQTTKMSNDTSLANTASNNATSIKTTGMNNAQSGANTKATNLTHLAVAGLNPDGSPMADVDATVKAIGEYRMQPPTLQALRNPRIAAMMDQVNARYPGFDATQYGARQGASKSFSTGKDGQAIQSANTALNHLDTLRELAQAQGNGDIRLFNQLANRFATETGGAAPTNLQGAVTMVGPEISKAVVGAGGGVGDREKVDAALQALVKGGPQQAAGQINTMQDLFGGRLTEAQRTYKRTVGGDDFADKFLSPAAQKVLASRGAAGGNAALHSQADAILRGGK